MTCQTCGLRVVAQGHRDASECIKMLKHVLRTSRGEAETYRRARDQQKQRAEDWRAKEQQARDELAAAKRELRNTEAARDRAERATAKAEEAVRATAQSAAAFTSRRERALLADRVASAARAAVQEVFRVKDETVQPYGAN